MLVNNKNKFAAANICLSVSINQSINKKKASAEITTHTVISLTAVT
jgi:hypothetical protein